MTRAEKKPDGFLGRLRSLIAAAEKAAQSGQSINAATRKTKVSNGQKQDFSTVGPKGSNKGMGKWMNK